MSTSIIRIDSHIPIPENIRGGGVTKYKFMNDMNIGDSFEVRDDNEHITPHGVRAHAYNYKYHNKNSTYKFSVRLISGTSKKPRAVRIWRIK